MGRQTRRVRTTRALWFWWSGIGTQPFHELAHTHTTLHHHLATRRTHAHAQHKILATHIIARMRGSHSRSTLNVGVFFVIPVAGAIPHTHPAPPHLHRQVRPDAHRGRDPNRWITLISYWPISTFCVPKILRAKIANFYRPFLQQKAEIFT